MGRAQRDLLRLIAAADRLEAWRGSGARHGALALHPLRAVALEGGSLDRRRACTGAAARRSEAFEEGELSIDKVVEIAQFATPEEENRLIRWAKGVSCGAVRHRGDLAPRSIRDVREAERTREVSWCYHDEGRRFRMSVDVAAAHGPTITRALEREAEKLTPMPGEEGEYFVSARRADALVALCSASDASPGSL